MAKALKAEIKQAAKDLIQNPSRSTALDIDEWEFQALAGAIKEAGLLDPVLIRAKGGRFEVVAGHKRLLAYWINERRIIPFMRCNVEYVRREMGGSNGGRQALLRVTISKDRALAMGCDGAVYIILEPKAGGGVMIRRFINGESLKSEDAADRPGED